MEADSLGPIQEHMLLALFIAWILVFLGVFKGIGSIGWAASITATVPYLLVRAEVDYNKKNFVACHSSTAWNFLERS